MRARGAWALLLLLAPSVAAQPSPVEAAVGPAQIAVAETARLLQAAIVESLLSGLTDDALLDLVALDRYVAALEAPWNPPHGATYGRTSVLAFEFAIKVVAAARAIPQLLPAPAQAKALCAYGPIDFALRELAIESVETVANHTEQLESVAGEPPEGVDTTAIFTATGALATWVADHRLVASCPVTEGQTAGYLRGEVVPDELGTPSPTGTFLNSEITPLSAWPGARIRVAGETSEPGPVLVDVRALDLVLALPLTESAFAGTFDLPMTQPEGPIIVHLKAGNLTSSHLLQVKRLPSFLELRLPSSPLANSTIDIEVRLTSQMPNQTDAATIILSGLHRETVRLEGGRGLVRLTLPDAPGRYTLRATFDGNSVVAPSTVESRFQVLAKGPIKPVDSPRWPVMVGVALFAVAALVAIGWTLRPRGSRERVPPPVSRPAAPSAPETREPSDLIEAVASLREMLIHENRARPSTTARELARSSEEPAQVMPIAHAFERERYGNRPTETSWLPRALAWLRAAARGGVP